MSESLNLIILSKIQLLKEALTSDNSFQQKVVSLKKKKKILRKFLKGLKIQFRLDIFPNSQEEYENYKN